MTSSAQFPEVGSPASGLTAGDAVARLSDGRVELRPLSQQDYGLIWHTSMSQELIVRWRHRGSTPAPESFAASLWQGVLVNFVATEATSGRPLGLWTAYDANHLDGYCYVASLKFDAEQGNTRFLQSGLLFVGYLLDTWPFRKLHAEALAVNLDQFRSGIGRLFVEEGRLRDHAFIQGSYQDLVTLTVWRQAWEAEVQRLGQAQLRLAAMSEPNQFRPHL